MKRTLLTAFSGWALGSIVALVAASAASADAPASSAPKKGDSATYEFRVSQASDQVGTVTWTITMLDPASDKASLAQSSTFAGHTQNSALPVSYKSLLFTAQALADCAGHGGSAETITVPAGKFETCKISKEDASSIRTIWFGAVPVRGFVKLTQVIKAGNATTEFDLKSSHSAE